MLSEGFVPFMVEKTLKAEIEHLRLKGKIDRVDIRQSMPGQCPGKTGRIPRKGSVLERGEVALLDYKTGAIDVKSLQLPLYACLWRREMTHDVVRTGYYALQDCSVTWFPKKSDMESYESRALSAAEDIVRKIREGLFPPEPSDDGVCRSCDHKSLCFRGSGS